MAELVEEKIEAAEAKEEQPSSGKQGSFVSVTDLSALTYCRRMLYMRKVLGYEEKPNEAMVLGSIRHSFYDVANKHEEGIVAKLPSQFTKEETIAAYSEMYQNLLRAAVIDRARSLSQFDIQPFQVLSMLMPVALIEAKARAEHVFSFAALHHVFGEELWHKLSPKILSELRVRSAALQLKGVVDKVEIYEDSVMPIELKTGKMAREGVWPSHRVQVAAYMMLLREKFRMPVNKAVISYLDHGTSKTVMLNPYMEMEVKELTQVVLQLLCSGKMPKPCGRERCGCGEM